MLYSKLTISDVSLSPILVIKTYCADTKSYLIQHGKIPTIFFSSLTVSVYKIRFDEAVGKGAPS